MRVFEVQFNVKYGSPLGLTVEDDVVLLVAADSPDQAKLLASVDVAADLRGNEDPSYVVEDILNDYSLIVGEYEGVVVEGPPRVLEADFDLDATFDEGRKGNGS